MVKHCLPIAFLLACQPPGGVDANGSATKLASVTGLTVTFLDPVQITLATNNNNAIESGWEVCAKTELSEVSCLPVLSGAVSLYLAPCARYQVYARHDKQRVETIAAVDVDLETPKPHTCAKRLIGPSKVSVGNVELSDNYQLFRRAASGPWQPLGTIDYSLAVARNPMMLNARFALTRSSTEIVTSTDALTWTPVYATQSRIIVAAGATPSRGYWVTIDAAVAGNQLAEVVTSSDLVTFTKASVPSFFQVVNESGEFKVLQMGARTIMYWVSYGLQGQTQYWTSTNGVDFTSMSTPCTAGSFVASALNNMLSITCAVTNTRYELIDGISFVASTQYITPYARAQTTGVDALLGYDGFSLEPWQRNVTDTMWQQSTSVELGGRITDISYNPTNPAIQRATLESGAIVSSNDQGVTWSLLKAGEKVSSVAASATRAVATSDGGVIWRSALNDSSSWTSVLVNTGLLFSNVLHVSGTTFIATAQRRSSVVFLRSTDDGATWTQVLNGSTAYRVEKSTSYLLACDSGSTKCWRSDAAGSNPGGSWTEIDRVGLSSFYSMIGYDAGFLAISEYASGNLFYSPDGITWVAAGFGVNTMQPAGSHVFLSKTESNQSVFYRYGGIGDLVRLNNVYIGTVIKQGGRFLSYSNGFLTTSADGLTFSLAIEMPTAQFGNGGNLAFFAGKLVYANPYTGELLSTTPPP